MLPTLPLFVVATNSIVKRKEARKLDQYLKDLDAGEYRYGPRDHAFWRAFFLKPEAFLKRNIDQLINTDQKMIYSLSGNKHYKVAFFSDDGVELGGITSDGGGKFGVYCGAYNDDRVLWKFIPYGKFNIKRFFSDLVREASQPHRVVKEKKSGSDSKRNLMSRFHGSRVPL